MYKELINKMEGTDKTIYRSHSSSEDDIKQASDLLGVTFPEDLISYLKTFGSLSFGSFELNGIIDNTDMEAPVNCNMVGLTLEANKEYSLPNKFVIVGSAGAGDDYVLCCDNDSNSYGKIFYWNPEVVSIDNMESAFESFYLLVKAKVERQLS